MLNSIGDFMNKIIGFIYKLFVIMFPNSNFVVKHVEKQLLKEMNNSSINILGISDSLQKIKCGHKSICRFGDGELSIICGKDIKFQKSTPECAKKLKDILKEEQKFCYIGIPSTINTFKDLTYKSKTFWIVNMLGYRSKWIQLLNPNMEYLAANVTRLYIDYEDKSKSKYYFKLMKNIWEKKDVVICEGEQTRMGIGNDLLDNCNSVKRIICPSENAFEKYFEILTVLKQKPKDSLILLALGPTATILAYELAKEGYTALDVGHLDIEYEWFLKNAVEKEKIDKKYVSEVTGGTSVEEIHDEKYFKQIETIIK